MAWGSDAWHAADAIRELHPGAERGVESWQRQLLWREFASHLLLAFPNTVDEPLKAPFARFPWRRNDRGLVAWQRGLTGYPFIDAGMRQLLVTGAMHNRARMVAASFLVKDLHLPWQWGARWFLEQLVDGDMANNQHGWQWAAGCGTDAAPYFRVFNPTTQGVKFDPSGDYVRRWVPELSGVDDVHKLGADRPDGYPQPMVDHAEERSEALRRYGALK